MIDKQEISEAVAVLRSGGLVAFPTETVYGLGADASNPAAVQKIFDAKGRPADHPLIVHVGDVAQLSQWAQASPAALQLAQAFWPGPLTLVLPKVQGVSDLITGGQDTIGIRIPNHPIALALLKAFGGGLAAPSANRFGRISPTTAIAVVEELGHIVTLVLDGGQCEVGVESTIVDVCGERPVILRPGMISARQIETVLKMPVAAKSIESPRVSGSMESHYAPHTRMSLIATEKIVSYLSEIATQDLPLALLSYTRTLDVAGVERVVMPNNPVDYAHKLYAVLREIDKKNLQRILVEAVPETPDWDAVRDRLRRASGVNKP